MTRLKRLNYTRLKWPDLESLQVQTLRANRLGINNIQPRHCYTFRTLVIKLSASMTLQ